MQTHRAGRFALAAVESDADPERGFSGAHGEREFQRAALAARKEHKPKGCVISRTAATGIEVLTEEEYLALQKLGEFDTKRSNWLQAPPEIRKLGGAIFEDRRFGRVFIQHNGAEYYYSGRGFRGVLRV